MNLPSDIIIVSIDDVWRRRDRLLDALTRGEDQDFGSLRYEKRRRDWLAGRVAAKRALQRHCGLSFRQIEVRAEENGPTSGRPAAWINGRAAGCLSISHSGDLAMATWSPHAVGIDAEMLSLVTTALRNWRSRHRSEKTFSEHPTATSR